MGNLSKSSFFDAGTNPPRRRIIVVDGARREERLPNGVVERWVDAVGNVVFQQMISSGLPFRREMMDKARSEIRNRPGRWFEYHRCPLTQGTLTLEDFPTELHAVCRPNAYGVDRPCVHVKHMVQERQTAHAAARETRHAAMNAEKLRKEALDKQQLDATLELNTNLRRIAESAAGGAKPVAGDPPSDKPTGNKPKRKKRSAPPS